jgi:Lrp/AsnC family leucine-responsive transcriptional regulator
MPAKLSQFVTAAFGQRSPLLDSVNVQLLGALQEDPSATVAALARRVGMSAPAVAERLARLREAHVLLGFRVELDPKAVGLPIAAYIRVRPGPGLLPKLAELAQQTPEVVECHRITGEDCFLMKVHVAAVEEMETIIDRFLAFGQTTTSIVQSSPVPPRPLPLPILD